jgi:hypothetical protein
MSLCGKAWTPGNPPLRRTWSSLTLGTTPLNGTVVPAARVGVSDRSVEVRSYSAHHYKVVRTQTDEITKCRAHRRSPLPSVLSITFARSR